MTRIYPQYRSLTGAIVLVFLICIFLYRKDDGTSPSIGFLNRQIGPDCDVDIEFLRSFGYNDSIDYARWNIEVVQSKEFAGFSDSLDLPEPAFNPLELGLESGIHRLNQSHCVPPARVTIPPLTKPVDASHIIVGVATTIDRLNDTLPVFARWASGTNVRVISIVEADPFLNTTEVLQHAERLDIRLHIVESDEEFLDRYYMLTRTLLEFHDESTQWAVIIDDDTFFPSMEGLVAELATYDHTKPYYIGAPTENLSQMASFTYMAYGGAGVFLSIPLLKEIDLHFDDCYDNKDHGDKRVSACIYTFTSTKLTWNRRLFQLDISPDGSGFYESGRQLPLSLHHWKSQDWYPVDILSMAQVSDVCGHDCQLRRWKITDELYLVNGFSLVKYSYPMTPEDLAALEQTWDYFQLTDDHNWAFSLGPLRPRDNGKESWSIVGAVSEGNRVRQVYMQEPNWDNDLEVPQFLEIVWTLTR